MASAISFLFKSDPEQSVLVIADIVTSLRDAQHPPQ